MSNGLCLKETKERLSYAGAPALSGAELITLLVGDAGLEIWKHYGSCRAIANAPVEELAEFKGSGRSYGIKLKAAAEFGRRLAQEDLGLRSMITSPEQVANLLMPEMRDLEQEHLKVVMLDTKHHVIGIETIYIGTVNTSIIRIAEIFKPAIRKNVTSIILAHNHPSGDPQPSAEDVHVTRRVIEAGRLMDIEVLDHLVIGDNRHVSLKERGLAFAS